MRFLFPAKLHGLRSRIRSSTLIVCWCSGLLFGTLAAATADGLSALMHAYLDVRVSIVSLIFLSLIPLIISAVAVFLSYPWLLCFVSFCKAFCFAFCARFITLAFGSAGFLLCFLLLFTDFLTHPALCLYWLRHKEGNRAHWLRDAVYCSVWFVIVVISDHTFVNSVLIKIF